jgi:hypothetical protein
MHIEISLDSILQRLSNSLLKVKHVTAFIEEETLKTAIIYSIVAFLGAAITILAMILLRRTIAINRNKKRKILVEKYENYLAETMTYVYENDKIFEKKTYQYTLNKEDQTHPFNRHVLLDQIMLMRKHVGGEEGFILSHLYEKLGFHRASLKKTKSLLWHTRLEGLQELILMSATSFEKTVLRMIHDSNPFIRIEAVRALILRGQEWQKDLIRYSYPLSAWEQYQICDALSRVQNIQLPDFTPLLASYNPSVLLFGLRMIKHFHCMEAIQQVVPFLVSPNPHIVDAAKQVLEQFGYDEALINEDISVSNADLTIEQFNFSEEIFNINPTIPDNDFTMTAILKNEEMIPIAPTLIAPPLIKKIVNNRALMVEILTAAEELRVEIDKENKRALMFEIMTVARALRIQMGMETIAYRDRGFADGFASISEPQAITIADN